MSGFENYKEELANLDHEIRHYAAVCGVNLANRGELEQCVMAHHESWASDKARESLHGLLILRIKLESEMLGEGIVPPPLSPPAE